MLTLVANSGLSQVCSMNGISCGAPCMASHTWPQHLHNNNTRDTLLAGVEGQSTLVERTPSLTNQYKLREPAIDSIIQYTFQHLYITKQIMKITDLFSLSNTHHAFYMQPGTCQI